MLKLLCIVFPTMLLIITGGELGALVASRIFELPYLYHYLKRPYELLPLPAEDMPAKKKRLFGLRSLLTKRAENDTI